MLVRSEKRAVLATRLKVRQRPHFRSSKKDDPSEIRDLKDQLAAAERALHAVAQKYDYPEWVWPGKWKEFIVPLISDGREQYPASWKLALSVARILDELFDHAQMMRYLIEQQRLRQSE